MFDLRAYFRDLPAVTNVAPSRAQVQKGFLIQLRELRELREL
jgi:hypothetical protein